MGERLGSPLAAGSLLITADQPAIVPQFNALAVGMRQTLLIFINGVGLAIGHVPGVIRVPFTQDHKTQFPADRDSVVPAAVLISHLFKLLHAHISCIDYIVTYVSFYCKGEEGGI